MGEIPRQELDTLKSEHLAEGIRPIMACVGTKEQYANELAGIKDIEKVGQNVDFYLGSEIADNLDFKNAGDQTYIISAVNDRPKFTHELRNCTSLVVVGREVGSEKELSFLTHQEPGDINHLMKDLFVQHLKERLEELKRKCLAGTIDVVIAGGRFYTGEDHEYEKTLELLGSIVQEAMGFEPLVISGPKSGDEDDVYFDTEKRRLYVIRPSGGGYASPIPHNEPFKPSQIGEMRKKWEEEEKKHKPFGDWQ